MKKCPFCAEEIQDDAIKCRFCNEIIVGNPILTAQNKQEEKKVPWYRNGFSIWVSYILFLPISVLWCVPLTWIHPKWSTATKIITSVIMVVFGWWLTTTAMHMLGNISQYYGSAGIKVF